jgi:peptide deformylase
MEKITLRIRKLGDSALRRRSYPVREITQAHRNILSEMARLMYDNSGIGLAMPQVGFNENMIVADIGSGLYKLVNPVIVAKKGWQVNEEGCLSIPGVCVSVRRAKKIIVRALDEQSEKVEIAAEGLLACVLQHEIDHLKGRLIIDYASFLEKINIKSKIRKLSQSEAGVCKLQL